MRWQRLVRAVERTAGVVAVSPAVRGPAFARRGEAWRMVVSLGGDLPRFTSICAIDRRRVDGAYRLTGDGCLVGAERSADLRVGTRDEPSVSTSQGYDDVLVVAGVCDLGNRDVNGRWEVTSPRPARSLLDLAGGGSAIDVKVADVFAAQEIAERLAATTGLSAASWMRTSTRL